MSRIPRATRILASVLLAAGRWDETVSSPSLSFLFGALLALSVMASYVMAAYAAALAVFWAGHSLRAWMSARLTQASVRAAAATPGAFGHGHAH